MSPESVNKEEKRWECRRDFSVAFSHPLNVRESVSLGMAPQGEGGVQEVGVG